MSSELESKQPPEKWGVMREFRSVLIRYSELEGLDFTEDSGSEALTKYFAHYYARLKSEAARQDRPECKFFIGMAHLCAPEIFAEKLVAEPVMLSRPATDIIDTVYPLAMETQKLAPGSVYLRTVENFKNIYQTPNGVTPIILEYNPLHGRDIESPVARIPLLLQGLPGHSNFLDTNLPLISRTVDIIKILDAEVDMKITTIPNNIAKSKEFGRLTANHLLLEWPLKYLAGDINTPIVGALTGRIDQRQNGTSFQSISIKAGGTEKKWVTAKKSFFGLYSQYENSWRNWSYANTMNNLKKVAIGEVVKKSANLTRAVLGIPGINLSRNRESLMALHIPTFIIATFTQVASSGIRDGLQFKSVNHWNIIRERQEEERRHWDNFYLE